MTRNQKDELLNALGGLTERLSKEAQGSVRSVPDVGHSQEQGTATSFKEPDILEITDWGCSDETNISSAAPQVANTSTISGVAVNESEWRINDADSPVLDVYEVSSGYASDHRPDSETTLPYDQYDRQGQVPPGMGAYSFGDYDASNRLGKPDAHPEVMSGRGQDTVQSRRRNNQRRNILRDVDVDGEEPAVAFGASHGVDRSNNAQGARHSAHVDWRTPGMISRDAYRMMMEEEALCLISRLESMEADRQAMRETIDSLRRENGEMKILQEIAQQLREMRKVEKQSSRKPEPWQQEASSGNSLKVRYVARR